MIPLFVRILDCKNVEFYNSSKISLHKAFCFVTVRKLSLQRLCFYTCLSVILLTGGSTWAGNPPRQVHPQAGNSLAGTPPLGRYPTRQVQPPQAGTPPGRYTLLATVHAGTRSTSREYASHWNAFLLSDSLINIYLL